MDPIAGAAAPLDEAIAGALRARARPDEVALALRFAELLFADATAEFFLDRTPDQLASLALAGLRHLQRSRPDRIDVDVRAPEDEDPPWSGGPVTVIRTNVGERPFVVGTIREYLYARQLPVGRFLHPVLEVRRDMAGHVVSVDEPSPGAPMESIVHCEVPRIADPAVAEEVRARLADGLADVVLVTDDFEAMLDALGDAAAGLEHARRRLADREAEVAEVQEFLRWLRPNFVFVGYYAHGLVDAPSSVEPVADPGTRLGLARRPEWAAAVQSPAPAPPPPTAGQSWPPRLLTVAQSTVESTVHRRERLQSIVLRTLDAGGAVVGERCFLGLFRARAYQEEADRIPILRRKLQIILEQADWLPGSHNYREAIKIFNSMPKEELFLARAVDIGREIHAILTQYYTHEVKVTLRPDAAGRTVSAMVIMPRDRYSGRARRGIQTELMRQLDATVLNTNLVMGGGQQARLHFQLATTPDRLAAVSLQQLEQHVRELIQTWSDVLELKLALGRTPEEAGRLTARWAGAFSGEYQAATPPDDAVVDIEIVEAMEREARTVDLRLSNPPPAAGDEAVTRLKVYLRGARIVLSDVMPIFENAGLRVLSMSAFEGIGGGAGTFIYIFDVQDSNRQPLDLAARGALLSDAILAVGAGETANDPLNALILAAGLSWREVDVLRAYCEYGFQLALAPARASLTGPLRAYPAAARLLIDIFTQKFDPAAASDLAVRLERLAELRLAFIESLETVTSLADDRALRSLLALLDATVRTNYFLHGGARPTARSGGVPYLSIKFLNELLQPIVPSRLRAEVWVQSARMAGIHMRRGAVSRGGIRHSDRPDDLRTEVLGLVRTQSVKNAVIVPAGSKGGFVTRRRRSDARKQAEEVEAQYRTLVRGLLDITDNLVDGEPVRPAALVVHDEPDPYLVVAADKGTATFSDLANEVAAEYGFWLDDAFASGGSNGYDHKKVGITARGAWESVRRHFREMGRDTQTEPFTVVGIGDMSGDVFGNGMLLSRQIRLVAAFDHRHIFVDPDPDPAASYLERQRLFRLPRSSWDDYDRSLLSRGGFIVPRGIKSVVLSPEACAALGVDEAHARMDGETLMRTILRAPVDLLWNGGIGTYVKSPDERHADVGDSANDAVRVDADELRCRVIGEGGNLGLTQRARIRFALDGGRCYTDAIDNSGGVDMSDREVNLKILLGAAVAEGRLDRDARNTLLRELTDAVTDKVLGDNRSQTLGISLDELRAKDGVEDMHGLMVAFERRRVMDRAGEALPTLEVLVERRAHGRSLTKPELSVLLAYTKLTLKQSLLDGAVPDDPALQELLVDYFPDAAVDVAGAGALAGHRLCREIIATQLANELVDLMGSAFVHRVTRDTGHDEAAAARAWFIAARLAGARELRGRLAELEGRIPSDVVYRWLLGLARVLERTTHWILANTGRHAAIEDIIAQYLGGLKELRGDFGSIVTGEERDLFEARIREAQQLTTTDLAASIVTLRFLDQLLEIIAVAGVTGRDVFHVGRAYYAASALLAVPRIRQAIAAAAGESRWDQRLAQTLDHELRRAHRALTRETVTAGGDTEPVDVLLARAADRHADTLAGYRSLLDDMASDERPSLAALLLAVRQLEPLGG